MKTTKEFRLARGPLLLAVAILGVAFINTPSAQYLTRFGLDFALPFVAQDDPLKSDVVMVVIDEVTHVTEPFSETPEVAWTPYLGDVIKTIDDAGAAAIGLDIIYPKTLSGPDLLPGYDRPFLSALFQAGRAGRLVLGETRLSDQTIRPYQGQILAAGGADNVSPLQLTPDLDGVVRSYPAGFAQSDGSTALSFANELLLRAGKTPRDTPFLLDFVTAIELPAYRLSDMVSCSQNGEDVTPLFQDKIVLIGVALDVEDRHVASNRFVAGNQPRVTDLKCGPQISVNRTQGIHRQSVPGVSLHARAVQTLLHGEALHILSPITVTLLTAAMLLALGVLYLRIPPLGGFVLLIVGLLSLWGAAILLLGDFLLIPYLSWGIAALLSYILLYTYRVFFENKEKRWIRHAFRHYLSPALVDQLADDPSLLKLGGERRHVAILFLDLAGFTKASEALIDQPETLVGELNRYLAEMADIIEAHGGYVDKFIGDAVMGIWGAPVPNAAAEDAAARASLACAKAMTKMNTGRAQSYIHGMRIGLNAGDAVVGNMGSEHRFNYTAVGDAVNLAARLESANKTYGTTILAGEEFVANLSDAIIYREVDYIQVAGRKASVHIYEIQGADPEGPVKPKQQNAAFQEARALFREQKFETAETKFANLAKNDPVARLYVQRCQLYQRHPPGDDWDGIFRMATK